MGDLHLDRLRRRSDIQAHTPIRVRVRYIRHTSRTSYLRILDGLFIGMIEHGHRGVTVVESLDEATQALSEGRTPGDIVITLGAGDVNRVCGELEAALNGC